MPTASFSTPSGAGRLSGQALLAVYGGHRRVRHGGDSVSAICRVVGPAELSSPCTRLARRPLADFCGCFLARRGFALALFVELVFERGREIFKGRAQVSQVGFEATHLLVRESSDLGEQLG